MSKPLPPFVEYIVSDILPNIGEFNFRPMMGCYILRSEGVTFSIIDESKWYIRTIPETEDWYQQNNCEKFEYTDKKGKTIYMPYYALPENIFDNKERLARLIQESIIAAQMSKK